MIIYKATNVVNRKIYIGKTVAKLDRRKVEHFSAAKSREYKSAFHNALLKYGENNFSWEIIDRCLFAESLDAFEKYYIDKFNSKSPNGYNLADGGMGNVGMKHSDETKSRLRAAQTGRRASIETRNKISSSLMGNRNMVGRRRSLETKMKLSAAMSGERNPNFGKRNPSLAERNRENIGAKNPMFGRRHSEESIKRMSGQNNPMFGKYGKDHPTFGRKHTEESKHKMSVARRARRGNEEI